MFVPVPTPEEMSRWDAEAIALGMAEDVLMESAARCAMDCLREHLHARRASLSGASVLLLAGSGNNGGDAFCMARHLLDAGACPVLVCTRRPDDYRGAASRWLRVAIELGVPVFSAEEWENGVPTIPTRFDIAVDALLGTGFRGVLREREQRLVHKFNSLSAPFVLAVDIPSGLDARTGRPCPAAVRAHVTVSFQAAKPGLLLPEAEAFTGLLDVRPIGMPRRVQEENRPSFRTWLLPAQIKGDRTSSYTLERRPSARTLELLASPVSPSAAWDAPAHKGDAGRVLVIGGCSDYAGAPCLAGLGALCSGAGLVTVAGPEPVLDAVRSSMPALTTQSIPRLSGHASPEWSAEAAASLIPALSAAKAVVFGPGLGRSEGAADFAEALLSLPHRPPMVLDADALFALASRPYLFKALRPCDVLTPHPGEAAAILGIPAARVQEDRFAALDALTSLVPAVWVLKGAGTLIAVPDEPSVISPWDVPQLAVAGSGDVLAGAVGTFLAQGHASGTAAVLGVWLHALAGISLSQRFPMRGNSPQHIARALSSVLAALGIPSRGEPCPSF
ncbi:NAD(P)H-hydrate dehydratase [Mailhella sp.]|uniref:NAD(P)H-hydrate dehydratase n=1 Tax=Mailhella sp. TaxID=1981029 RepID=UPI0040646D1D